MPTRQNDDAERDGVPLAQTRAADRGDGLRVPGRDGDAPANPINCDDSSGVAAHRLGRRIIAWGLRRSIRLARRGRTIHAITIMRRLANLAPNVPVVQLSLARLASGLGDMGTVNKAVSAALAIRSAKEHRYYCHIATLLLRLQELDAAEACLKIAEDAFPASPRVWMLLAELHRYRAETDEAVRCFERALMLATSPEGRLRALTGLANCCSDTGRIDDAILVGRRMVELSPGGSQGYRYLVSCQRGSVSSDEIIQSMRRLLGSKSLSWQGRMSLHYSLGMVCDGCGDHGEAFAHFLLANNLRARNMRSRNRNAEPSKEKLEARIKVFDSEFITAMSEHGCKDDFLICVVGFPRSGTTLIEQILSSHPDVIGLGERTDFFRVARGLQAKLKSRREYPLCCAAMTPNLVSETAGLLRAQLLKTAGLHTRVVTKSPEDCWELGLIRILFPRARFIHCRRHPIDNCLSCFMQHFKSIPFSTDLARLAEAYRLYRQIMGHWQQVLPQGSIFDCLYEQVAAEPEPLMRSLHERCGIPFNENWSRFHDHARRVDTASVWQVRRPIYQTSVQRWRNYARFLGPLLQLDGE